MAISSYWRHWNDFDLPNGQPFSGNRDDESMSAILDREELTAEVANLKDSQGRTPLIICLQEGSPYMVRYGHRLKSNTPPPPPFQFFTTHCGVRKSRRLQGNTFVSEGYSMNIENKRPLNSYACPDQSRDRTKLTNILHAKNIQSGSIFLGMGTVTVCLYSCQNGCKKGPFL